MVLTRKGYTKHYYAGTERVAARIGGGGLNSLCDVAVYNRKMAATASLLFNQSLDQVNNRALQENDLDCMTENEYVGEIIKRPIDGIPYQMQAKVEIYNDEFEGMINAMIDDPNDGREEEVYFYHSDHLGSASWITDGGGDAVQHLQYLPYGERYVDQRMSGYNERFTFTGKERDEETGYGYFGARYMDHELMTMWLSVDPMADKYPSISPYAYCAWNPVKLVDPDGRDFDPTTEEKYIKPYENEVRERMNRIDALRETDHWRPEYEEQYSEYQNILTEIDGMRNDKHNVYSIHTGVKMKKKTANGELRYSGVNDKGQRKISINLATKHKDVFLFMGTMAHELKHAYQYYNKQLGFVLSNGIQTNSSDSQALEREAHIRGDMFSGCHNVTNKQSMRYDYELNPSNYEFPKGTPYPDYPAATNVNDFSRKYGSNFIYNNF